MFTSCSDDDEEVVIKDDDEEGDDSDDDGKGDNEVVVPDSIARAVAAKFGLGWNLGNQLDAHNNGVAQEDCWGNKIATQALFDKVAEAGFKSVRIPVTWLGHVGAAPDYKIISG